MSIFMLNNKPINVSEYRGEKYEKAVPKLSWTQLFCYPHWKNFFTRMAISRRSSAIS